MKKVLLSALPLMLLFAPSLSRMPLFNGSRPQPDAGTVTAAALSKEEAHLGGVRARIAEAKRLLQKRPAPSSTESVTLAVEDAAAEIHLLSLPKETFTTNDAEVSLRSSRGARLRLRVVRPNYVNTTVRVSDEAGRELEPLVVEYPVEKSGALSEVAYYTSAHPALGPAGIKRAGGGYVRRTLDSAARRLAGLGKPISASVVDVAERLCVVEHADHKRFRAEDRAALFAEIQALYALNAGDTYRYSVSSAGAGGMVQMIPPTYQAIREQHPEVGLHTDFVAGMRDHSNAAAAMLLYMQDTWDALTQQEEITGALAAGLATQPELLAAGYNSNPLRLRKYIERGGAGWRELIPRETQTYLQIYASVEELVDFKNP